MSSIQANAPGQHAAEEVGKLSCTGDDAWAPFILSFYNPDRVPCTRNNNKLSLGRSRALVALILRRLNATPISKSSWT